MISSADGTDIRWYDEGRGPAVLIVGPGMDDGSRTKKLAGILARRFRVLRLRRRQYRMDLKSRGPSTIADEVADVCAVAGEVAEPLVIYGHSSGGVVALEALAASPTSFAGAVIYEPAAVTELPIAGEQGWVVSRARAALRAGKVGAALRVFMRESAGTPAWQAWVGGCLVPLTPRYRRLIPAQIDDLEALHQLGNRLDVYAKITTPTLLLEGDRSPRHLIDRQTAIEQAMPRTERVVMPGRDHGADLKDTSRVASIIETFANKCFPAAS